jgi:hypothetical protein
MSWSPRLPEKVNFLGQVTEVYSFFSGTTRIAIQNNTHFSHTPFKKPN